jgi:hypothetical protein
VRGIAAKPILTLLALALAGVAPSLERTLAEGVVCDFFGTPLAGAQVRVTDSSGRAIRQTTTDALGRYELADLPTGQLLLAVMLRGFRVREQVLRVSAGDHFRLTTGLEVGVLTDLPPIHVSGLVRSQGGEALSHARVTAACEYGSGAQVETRADGAGRYSLSLQLPGQYAVCAAAAGFSDSSVTLVLPATLPRVERTIDFTLRSTQGRGWESGSR